MGEGDLQDLKRTLLEASVRPVEEALGTEGITLRYLVKRLKRELNAKETKFFKVNVLSADSLGKEVSGGQGQGEGETAWEQKIVGVNTVDWGTRQRARIDAHKLRGDYAPEKHDISMDLPPKLTDEELKFYKRVARERAQEIVKRGDRGKRTHAPQKRARAPRRPKKADGR